MWPANDFTSASLSSPWPASTSVALPCPDKRQAVGRVLQQRHQVNARQVLIELQERNWPTNVVGNRTRIHAAVHASLEGGQLNQTSMGLQVQSDIGSA